MYYGTKSPTLLIKNSTDDNIRQCIAEIGHLVVLPISAYAMPRPGQREVRFFVTALENEGVAAFVGRSSTRGFPSLETRDNHKELTIR